MISDIYLDIVGMMDMIELVKKVPETLEKLGINQGKAKRFN